jgi:hypothetical protein
MRRGEHSVEARLKMSLAAKKRWQRERERKGRSESPVEKALRKAAGRHGEDIG